MRHIFHTISRDRSWLDIKERTLLPFPCLVTLICELLMTEEELAPVSHYKVYAEKAKTSYTYNSCKRDFWTPITTVEDVPTEEDVEEVEY